MQQTSYTPGPWASCETRSREGWVDIASPGGFIIGQVLDLYSTEIPRANAHLIAFAPDLLEALRNMMPLALAHLKSLASTATAEEDDTADGLANPEKWELSRQYYAARAAIANAEGKP